MMVLESLARLLAHRAREIRAERVTSGGACEPHEVR
jgi:hypothetical protein